MFKILFSLLLLFPSFSFAQNFICQNEKPIHTISITEDILTYNMNLFANQFTVTKSISSNSHVLGSFRPFLSTKGSSQIGTLTQGNNSCVVLKEVNISVNLTPTITISREAQSFQCTYQRVLAHEQQHYKNMHNALVILGNQIDNLVSKYFDNIPANYNNQYNLPAYVKQQSQALQQEVNYIIEANSSPYDQQMDTKENYERENMSCGINERILLQNLLK